MAEIGRIGSFNRVGKIERDTQDNSGLDKLHGTPKNSQSIQGEPARNAKVDEVAKLYEKQFLGEMMKAMRGSTNISGEKQSMGESIYRDQLDSQYVESWGDNGGIGLANLIYDQLMERYFSGPGKSLKGEGGFKVTDREINRINRVGTNTGSATSRQVPLKIETKPNPDGSPAKLEAPWRGTVLANQRVDGKTTVILGHAGGLKSSLIFDGVAGSDVEPGKVLEKGHTVGVLSPDVHSFFLNLNRPVESISEPGAGLGTAL